MEDACREFGHLPAVLTGDSPPLSFTQLAQLCRYVDETLAGWNIPAPSAVAVLLPQSPQNALLCLALMRRYQCIPLNPVATNPELEQQLDPLRPALIITDTILRAKLDKSSLLSAIPHALLEARAGPSGSFHLLPPTPAFRSPPVSTVLRVDTALVLHTSGSTGRAKAVALSHTMLLSAIRRTVMSLRLSDKDCALNLLPLFHIGGLMDVLLAPLSVGGSVVLSSHTERLAVRKLLATLPVTWLQGVPTMLLEYSRTDAPDTLTPFRKLRFVRSVSAPLLPAQLAQLRRGFGVPIVEIYGMTETCGLICSNPVEEGTQVPASVGTPVATAVRIADTLGKPLPTGTRGEVLIRGEHVFAGYLGGEPTTQQDGVFIDGWFRSGDQGYVDDAGRLFLTGRIKELINRGGEKFSPLEVEIPLQTIASVSDAACFALPHPSLGEEPALAVVAEKPVDTELIHQVLGEQLAAYKIPRHIFQVDSLPKNASGKVQRHRLREQFIPTVRSTSPTSQLGPLGEQLRPLWQQSLGVTLSNADIDANFFDLGGDSLKAATLMATLSDMLGVAIPPALLFDNPTLVALEQALLTALPDDSLACHPALSADFPQAMLRELSGYLAGWQGKRQGSQSLLVGVNTRGSQPPVFWGCQSYEEFSGFCAQFSSDQPIYGFRSLFRVNNKDTRSNRALARYYCDEVQQLQACGPYVLGGFCEGASFAFYIAEALRERGEEVCLLMAVERFIAEPYDGRLCYVFSEHSSHSPFRRFDQPQTLWPTLYSGEVSCYRRNWKHRSFMASPCVELLGEILRAEIAAARRGLPSANGLPLTDSTMPEYPPESARRADIQATLPATLSPGQSVCLQVAVANRSDQCWLPGHRSGLRLYARWRRQGSGRVRDWKAGVAELTHQISPGSDAIIAMTVTAPTRIGRWYLELDVACEGLIFFAETGSTLCQLPCLVVYGGRHFSPQLRPPATATQEH